MKRRERAALVALGLMLAGNGLAESLLVATDLHLTEDAAVHAPVLSALAEAAREAEDVLFLGDNTNNAHDGEHAAMLEDLAALERLSGATAWVIPGNHDLKPSFAPSDFADLYAEYGWDAALSRDEASASYLARTSGGTWLLMLDTNRLTEGHGAEAGGGISAGTLSWVSQALSGLPKDAVVIACGHHPLLPAGQRGTPNADRLADILRAGGVKLYLCGHDHGFAAVNEGGLQQITVGQSQAYPGWAGLVTVEPDGLRWQTLLIYDEGGDYFRQIEQAAFTLGESMGRSTLRDTIYEGDEAAAQWFAQCFRLAVRGELSPAARAALLADPNAEKWRRIEPKTVVKRWMFGLLEGEHQDYRSIWVPIK